MFAPLILSVLMPLNPALYLRELVQWFIARFAQTLADQHTQDWIKANPKDTYHHLSLLGSLVMIEDMITVLSHIHARRILGHKPRRNKRRGRYLKHSCTGHPPTLEEIERRFERALQRLDAVEKNAEALVVKLARLFTNAVSQLERVHHAVETSSTTMTIFPGMRQKSSTAIQAAGQRIRAPPWPGLSPKAHPA